MTREIWIWIQEKFTAFFAWIGRGLKSLWRLFTGWMSSVSGSTWRKVALIIPVLFFLYVIIGMVIVNRIDDSRDLSQADGRGGSMTVTAVINLINREVRDNPWTPNDPVFQPGWWLDNTPNYQRGIIGALSRFSLELRDQVGRTRGSSAEDSDLQEAAGNLSKETDQWVMNFSTSLLPTTPADRYYLVAARHLESYNDRLAAGTAVFERRADNLYATIDRIALTLVHRQRHCRTISTLNPGALCLILGQTTCSIRPKARFTPIIKFSKPCAVIFLRWLKIGTYPRFMTSF